MPAAWGPYPDTVLVLPEAGIEIDLRYPLSSSARQALADQGLGGPFAVITACNPQGRPLGATANSGLTAVLAAVVQQQFPGAPKADGRSTDGRHVEPGWAVAISLEAARGLAVRFFQNALFWFDGSRFHIVPVLAPGSAVPLPVKPGSR